MIQRILQLLAVFSKPSTWVAVLAVASAFYGVFGTAPKPQWEGVKDGTTGAEVQVSPETAAGNAIVYRGVLADEKRRQELAEKLSVAMTTITALLAAILGQREKPPGSDQA
jgi:hypothetical protein